MADKKQFSNTKSIVKVETGIVTLISYHHYLKIVGNNKLWLHMQKESWNIHGTKVLICSITLNVVRDSSAIREHFSTCCRRGTSVSSTYGKQRICLSNSWSAHFHVSWLSDFIFYQKPLYKSLHQSFFYSFITILPSESGVTLHYSTILP
jgi:hypothetical protein